MEKDNLEMILEMYRDGRLTLSETVKLVKCICGKGDLVLPNRYYAPVLPQPYTNPYVTPYTGPYVTYTTATWNNTKSDDYDDIGNK